MAVVSPRKTASQRREAVLEAAREEFARGGLHAASTETIARRAGISHPYLFRLFGTKKELYLATVDRCLRETLETFREAADGRRGEAALKEMGRAYLGLLGDRSRLTAQLQAYADCEDADVREVVRRGFGELVTYVERASGASSKRVSEFFATGMLLNVVAAMDLPTCESEWAKRLLDGCRKT